MHLYQEEPFCAQLWYQKHLYAPVYAGRTSSMPLSEVTCQVARASDQTWPGLEPEGVFRTPWAAVAFSGSLLNVEMVASEEVLSTLKQRLVSEIEWHISTFRTPPNGHLHF